ncbi:hypothetical protein AGLY_009633 [Aphis glycines]|uniref:Uncharacterized protein n=1 Tax=Aphis glycines TaxID=307491 RepID=A0A6G0TIL0_APHGL|nr:hypothetical protein AGLY_009633 [Aphis glycines]
MICGTIILKKNCFTIQSELVASYNSTSPFITIIFYSKTIETIQLNIAKIYLTTRKSNWYKLENLGRINIKNRLEVVGVAYFTLALKQTKQETHSIQQHIKYGITYNASFKTLMTVIKIQKSQWEEYNLQLLLPGNATGNTLLINNIICALINFNSHNFQTLIITVFNDYFVSILVLSIYLKTLQNYKQLISRSQSITNYKY